MAPHPAPQPTDVLVLQSHRLPLPQPWLETCLASVRAWAAHCGYHYRFEDDDLLQRLPDDLRLKTADRPAIAADLARLAALEAGLAEGYQAAVWFDADMLMIDPLSFLLPDDGYALGREVWVQRDGRRWRCHVKVHNAFLLFRAGNPFLAFYRHAAERIVRSHAGAMAPQIVGPKLLTALHNVVGFPVAEQAAMLSPAVARDVLAGQGPALNLFRTRSGTAPACLNLCASLVGRDLAAEQLPPLIERLLARPDLLAPVSPD